ncbi:MAG: RNA 2',3'-cyclic phosphodiesterase [Candidatus Omnitrophota bacterium]
METTRSFIALEISNPIQKELARLQQELQTANADIKWVKPTRIHLTLKFLGDVSPQLLTEVKTVISGLGLETPAFEIGIERLGAFPTSEHPRVIWVGIGQGKECSQRLAKNLEEKLQQLGFIPEKKPFQPHLTLGRVRSNHNRAQCTELLRNLSVAPIAMRADKLVLFKSTLTPDGAIYEPLHEVKLP